MDKSKMDKMKFELIDELSDSQVQLLIKSMILDKYCMDKEELLINESGLIDVCQYLIDNGKILFVLNGVYGAYNELLYDLNFKGFTIESDDDINDGFMSLSTSIEKSRKMYHDNELKELRQENEQLKKELNELEINTKNIHDISDDDLDLILSANDDFEDFEDIL